MGSELPAQRLRADDAIPASNPALASSFVRRDALSVACLSGAKGNAVVVRRFNGLENAAAMFRSVFFGFIGRNRD